MKKLSEYLFFGALGGCLYYSFELLFRGFSHWTMFVLGGICLDFFFFQGNLFHWTEPFWKQVFRGILVVTCLEFITGIILNKWLKLAVWDYSRLPFNVMGQICLPFVVIFSGLCAVGIVLCGYLGHWMYGEEKPKFFFL